MKKVLVFALIVVAVVVFGSGIADAQQKQKKIVFVNEQAAPVVATIQFGGDARWLNANDLGASFCNRGMPDKLHCKFTVPGNKGRVELPNPNYKWINFAMAFKNNVGCNPPTTKAEVNLNVQGGDDVVDVSLVDGFTDKVQINVITSSKTTVLGPPNGAMNNQTVYGVYPLGCDGCAVRKKPNCPISTPPQCKGGTEYNPAVPCEHHILDAVATIEIVLVK